MKLPPAVTIHGLEMAQQALAPGLPVTLISGRAAATYAGCGWWRAVITASRHAGPDILDCGDAAGRALEALRAGCKLLVLDGSLPAFPRVAARAGLHGAVLLPARPPSLDLADRGAIRRLEAWLMRDTPARIG